MMTRIISTAEVKKHKHKDSVWIIIHDDVYDVSSFLEEHPGGEDSLLDVAGQDGTEGFEDVGHSEDARELLKKYKIGTLPPEEKGKTVDTCSKSKCSICSAASCPHIPILEKSGKTWRTYDGSSSSYSRPTVERSEFKLPTPPRIERRVQSIVVPKQSPSNLKWYLLALAGALVVGFALKKYLGNK